MGNQQGSTANVGGGSGSAASPRPPARRGSEGARSLGAGQYGYPRGVVAAQPHQASQQASSAYHQPSAQHSVGGQYGVQQQQHHGGGGSAGLPSSGLRPPTPSSDAEMAGMDSSHDKSRRSGIAGAQVGGSSSSATGSPEGVGGAGGATMDMSALADDDTVPTVFRWEHGGRQVYITGTFNGWSRQIPMHRSGNDFTYIHNLRRGKHAFKFIVDDEWRFAPDQPTVADIDGRINNFIDVTDFKAYTGDRDFEREKAAAEYGCYSAPGGDKGKGPGDVVAPGESKDGIEVSLDSKDGKAKHSLPPDPDGETFGHAMPDLDDYTKEPPPLPPHLRHIILNKPPQLQDTAALPVPQHVALNHLYCTAIKDNMMVLGITQRFKTKFVTTVYYSPCAS